MSYEPHHHNPAKNQIIFLGVFLALLMLGIILFAQKKPQYFSAFVGLDTALETTGKSLEEMRLDGLSRYCTFDQKVGGDIFVGQFFTFGGSVNMSLISKQKKDVIFFLYDQQKVYTWKTHETQGISYLPDPVYVYKHQDISIDLSEIRNAVCWEKPIDRIQFLLPPNISFNEK